MRAIGHRRRTPNERAAIEEIALNSRGFGELEAASETVAAQPNGHMSVVRVDTSMGFASSRARL